MDVSVYDALPLTFTGDAHVVEVDVLGRSSSMDPIWACVFTAWRPHGTNPCVGPARPTSDEVFGGVLRPWKWLLSPGYNSSLRAKHVLLFYLLCWHQVYQVSKKIDVLKLVDHYGASLKVYVLYTDGTSFLRSTEILFGWYVCVFWL